MTVDNVQFSQAPPARVIPNLPTSGSLIAPTHTDARCREFVDDRVELFVASVDDMLWRGHTRPGTAATCRDGLVLGMNRLRLNGRQFDVHTQRGMS